MDQPLPQDEDRLFALLDEAAIVAAKVWRDPHDFAFVEHAVARRHRDAVLDDAPRIQDATACGPPNLRYGPHFDALIDDLLSRRFARLVERKFDLDLSAYSPAIVMTDNTAGRHAAGYVHPDAKHKIVAVLIGFTRDWPADCGCLRVLRGADREDFAFEFAPAFDHMLMFRVTSHCWHSLLPHSGRGVSLQLFYVDSERYIRRDYWRHSMSPFAKSIPFLRKAIEWTPR